jgi:hypothetical protein
MWWVTAFRGSSAFHYGWVDQEAGLGVVMCPYKPGSEDAAEWLDGWAFSFLRRPQWRA